MWFTAAGADHVRARHYHVQLRFHQLDEPHIRYVSKAAGAVLCISSDVTDEVHLPPHTERAKPHRCVTALLRVSACCA